MSIQSGGAGDARPRLLVTIGEATRLLSLSRASIYRLISGGRLAAVKVAGRTLIPASSIERLIAEAPRLGRTLTVTS